MAGRAEDITYTVLALDQGDWQSKASSPDMFAAMKAAEQLFASRRFEQVKVDKQFYDSTNQRLVTTTILAKSTAKRRTLPILVWVAVALIGGVISFALTYLIAMRVG